VQTLACAGLAVLPVLGGRAGLRAGSTDGWRSAAEDSAEAPTTVFGAEVLVVVTTTATGDHPGDDPMAAEADGARPAGLDAQPAAAGLGDEGLRYGWYTPSADTWAEGDRETDCLLHAESEDGTLTGSLAEGTLVVDGSGSTV